MNRQLKKKLMMLSALMMSVLFLGGCAPDFGQRMAQAGMNTIMGISTVFVMLILIAFLISLFKYIGKVEKWFKDRKNTAAAPATVAVESQDNETEEVEDEIDDLELIAVITAALAASLGKNTDDLIVRSVRRRNSNHW